MAIGPECVTPSRRARRIKQTLLRNEHKRSRGMFSARYLAFCHRDFIERASDMYRSGTLARVRFPWNRRGESVIDFKHSRRAAKTLQATTVTCGQKLACHA